MARGHPILTFFVCIILFVLLVVASAVGILQHIVSEQAVSEMVFEIDVDVLVEELEIHERLVDLAGEGVVDTLGITPETISELLGRAPIRDFVAENASELIESLIHGQPAITISQEELFELLRGNLPYIEADFGVEIPEQLVDYLEELLYEASIPESITIDFIEPASGIDIDAYRWILLPSTFYIFAALGLGVAIVIIFINLLQFRYALIGIGVTAALSGALFLTIGASLNIAIPLLVQSVLFRELVAGLISQIESASRAVGIGQLAVGIALIVAYGICKAVSKET